MILWIEQKGVNMRYAQKIGELLKGVDKTWAIVGAGVVVVGVAGVIAMNVLTNGNSSSNPGGAAPMQDEVTKELPPLAFDNPVQERALVNLRNFGLWLRDNNAKGFIGEAGWPADSPEWDAVADKWYAEADRHDLWVAAWAAGSWWGGYPIAAYVHEDGKRSLDSARSQAQIIEKYPTYDNVMRGVNLAGMEFGTEEKDRFSSANPGIAGQQYFYEPEESMQYLAERGVKLVRLPFRWERVQPLLGGELDKVEIEAIKETLDAAEKNNIKVILDLHNYGVYNSPNGILQLGTTLTHKQFTDVWLRLSEKFKDHTAVAAYGLMNEPHDLPAGDYGSPAENWETASQTVLDALRDEGDDTLIMVAGYDWSSAARWAKNHPDGWIKDKANNFRYEAHHYWDSDGSGFYERLFQEEL